MKVGRLRVVVIVGWSQINDNYVIYVTTTYCSMVTLVVDTNLNADFVYRYNPLQKLLKT